MTPNDKIAAAQALLAEAFAETNAQVQVESSRARGALAQQCWRLRQMTGDLKSYFSQAGQDWFIDQVLLKERRGGVFVDVGGYDGVEGSNTFFFEVFRGWNGVLVETSSAPLAHAQEVRRCQCVDAVVSGEGGPREFMEVVDGYTQMSGRLDTYDAGLLEQLRSHPTHRETVRQVETRTLADILVQCNITAVDYLSLDIEGAEFEVLHSFPFAQIDVGVVSVENNTGTAEIHDFMVQHGYRLVEFLGVDEIYCPVAQL